MSEDGKLMKEAMQAVKSGNTHLGIQLFLRLTNEYPQSDLADNAFYNLGICYKNDQKFSKACLYFKTVVDQYADSDAAPMAADQLEDLENQMDPAASDYLKAEAFLHDGNLEDAARCFKSLLQSYPDSSLADNALFALGMIARKMGREEHAQQIFKKVVQDYPDSDAAEEARLLIR